MSELKEVTAMWVDKDGIHIAIPLDALVQFILKPFQSAGLSPSVEIDVARNRIKLTLGASDVKRLLASASANNPAVMGQLTQILSMAEELNKQLNQGNK